MNLSNLFEGAVDELERRRIEDLELKMDDLARRAKETTDPKVIAALRHEFAKAKSERDSYHYVQEWEDTAPGHDASQTSLDPVEEGWQDFNKVEPYAVCLAGKPVKKFDYYEDARRFHDNWKQKLYREGNKEKADKITLLPLGLDEDSMSSAEHHDKGPEFTGYWKGTDSGTPGDKMVGAAESKEFKVPAARNFVAKNMKSAGAGQHKDAKRAMKQGDVKHKGQRIPADESVNFMEWAVAQGSRFPNFTGNPQVYAQAKEAYIAEGMSNALSNITRRMAQPSKPTRAIKNRENKKDTIKRQHFAEDEVEEEKQKGVDGKACWKGYKRMGTKQKGGKTVDNCVKMEEDNNRVDPILLKALKRMPDGLMNHREVLDAAYDAYAIEKGYLAMKGNHGVTDVYIPQLMGLYKEKHGLTFNEDWQKANKKDKTDGMSQKAVNAYKREHPGSKLKTAVTTKPSKLKKGSKASKRRKSYCARSAGQKKMHNIDCSKTPDKAICKARKRWNCEGVENLDAMLAEAIEKGTLQPGQYYIWTVYFDDGGSQRIKVTRDDFDPKAYYARLNRVVINVDYDWTVNG